MLHPDRPDGNLLKHIKVRHGDVAQGFAQADVIVERTYRTPMTEHAFLEPECSIGVPAGYDAEHAKLTVYVGSQIPYSDRHQVAKSLSLADGAHPRHGDGRRLRQQGGHPERITALAAQITADGQDPTARRACVHERHATIIRVRTGATRDGILTAVEAELYGDSGAYASLGDKVMTRATTHATGPYAVPNAKIDCYAMYTNNAPCGAFRGFGVTQSAFAVESNMDILARELGIDPIELRRRARCVGDHATDRRCQASGCWNASRGGGCRGSASPWQPWRRAPSGMPGAYNGLQNTVLGSGPAQASRGQSSRTAAPRCASAAPNWARTWWAYSPPAQRRNWACPLSG